MRVVKTTLLDAAEPAKVVSNQGGSDSSEKNSTILDDKCKSPKGNYPSGNKCGHNRLLPRTYNPEPTHKPRPKELEQAKVNLVKHYFKPKRWLKSLCKKKDGSKKLYQLRSEKRETIKVLGEIFMQFVCSHTLRLGVTNPNGSFWPLSYERILEEANRGREDDDKFTIRRIYSGMQEFFKAKYIKITKRYTHTEEGEIRSLVAIKELTPQFFYDLGVNAHKLFTLREWKRKKLEKQQYKAAKRKLIKSHGDTKGFDKNPMDMVMDVLTELTKNIKMENPHLTWTQANQQAYAKLSQAPP